MSNVATPGPDGMQFVAAGEAYAINAGGSFLTRPETDWFSQMFATLPAGHQHLLHYKDPATGTLRKWQWNDLLAKRYDAQGNEIPGDYTITMVHAMNDHHVATATVIHNPSGQTKQALLVPVKSESKFAAVDNNLKLTNPTFYPEHCKIEYGALFEDNDIPMTVIYFSEVAKHNGLQFELIDFDIDLSFGSHFPNTTIEPHRLAYVTYSGADGSFKIINPKSGGLYTVDIKCQKCTTRIFTYLPQASSEIDEIVAQDILRADAFATKVNSKYNYFERNNPLKGLDWFYNFTAGDYLGRPTNEHCNIFWKFNQVNFDGFGAVVTWKGIPVRLAKASNFIVAYTCKKIGVSSANAWLAQFLGSANDPTGKISWDAGWAVASGGDYNKITKNALIKMWQWSNQNDSKLSRLWPNNCNTTNHFIRTHYYNSDKHFTSPAFLEITHP